MGKSELTWEGLGNDCLQNLATFYIPYLDSGFIEIALGRGERVLKTTGGLRGRHENC